MSEYLIDMTDDAKKDLLYYTIFDRKIIVSDIRAQLVNQPLIETKNRKKLRENPLAPWEMRSGIFRIFYQTDETKKRVTIVAIGHKEHNQLFIRGKEARI